MVRPSTTRTSRIPQSVQSVFLNSNRGKSVDKPPPNNVASKLFGTGWFRTGKKENGAKLKVGAESIAKARKKKAALETSTGARTEASKAVTSEVAPAKSINSSTDSAGSQSPATRLSPQSGLDAMLASRGYSTQSFNTIETAYFNKPTRLQRASHHTHLTTLVRRGEVEQLRSLLETGLSPNPCNAHGESLVHLVCRMGNAKVLRMLIDMGCSVQVADDGGRTPLHDACWTAKPAFDVIDLLLKEDRRLLHMKDYRGALPLSYVRKSNWKKWIDYLDARKEVYWPRRGSDRPESDPPLTKLPANAHPFPNPLYSLTPAAAAMVASGKLTPFELEMLLSDITESTADDDDDTLADSMLSDDKSDDFDGSLRIVPLSC